MQSQQNLRPAWDAILEVYKPFAEICKRHDLRMWASAGNVLGAVRHKGFIPWDDDFDVMLPRPDYDRFIREFASELPPHLKIITTANTPEYTFPFAKVQECRREVVDGVEKAIGRPMPQGVYIDVFPLEGFDAKRSRLGEPFWIYVYKFRRVWLCREFYPRSARFYHLQLVLGFLCGIFTPFVHSKRAFEREYERYMREIPFDGAAECTYYDVAYPHPKRFPMSCFATTKMLPYENIEVPVPGDYATYLTTEFGPTYMTPPPPEKRISNHQDSLLAQWKFGPTSAPRVP